MSILTMVFMIVVIIFKLGTRRPKRLPPGPTSWPVVGNLPHLGRNPLHSLTSLAAKYGPLMHLRLGYVDVVVVTSAPVAAQFLKAHDANFANRPPNSGAKHIAYNYHDMVFAPYGPRWRMLRKICAAHLFSVKALNDFRHIRQEEVALLMHALVVGGASPVKLGQLLNVCTANVLGRKMLGRREFGDGSGGADTKADEFKDMVVELMTLAGQFNIGDYFPALDWLDLQGDTRKMKQVHARFDSFLNTILEEHYKSNHDMININSADLLSTLIALKDDADGEGGKLSDIEIKALLLNLFAAGTDTSSSTVEWAIAELIRHPQLLQQAQEEMDTVVGRDRLVTELDLTQLPLLQAIVKETFRLHPAAPLSLPRMSIESCEVDGCYIPKGSTLIVNVWAIGRDPKVWTNPLEFQPTRFMPGGEKPNVDARGNNFELIPFGAGRRICVGMSLGLRMVQLLVATMVQSFDWKLANGLEPEKLNMDEALGISLQRAEPLMVHPKPRLPHVYKIRYNE